MKDCPSDDTLADFIEGRLMGAMLGDFYEHTSSCPSCTAMLAALVASPSVAGPSPSVGFEPNQQPGTSRSDRGEWKDQPEIVGRYRPIEVLGAGGMGIVYLAHDTQLNRNVALKITRAGVPRAGVLRMFREAQAMAQLAHRNVVTVHDVGVWDERVFVAMEHLEGGTLARYLLEQPRSWGEVLDRFVQAGNGLAAAHRAGIVHRDFKPENVLLSATGEARVGDFGLARWSGSDELQSEAVPVSHASLSIPESVRRGRLTRVGTLVGTPAYMPPEQVKGGEVDHRADIWSFCAALYEALYCELPFPGRTPAEVLRYVELGSVRAPPIGSDVPRQLRAALVRGLRAAPDARHPTMEALLEELQAPHKRRPIRTTWVVAGALTIAAVSLGPIVFGARGSRPSQPAATPELNTKFQEVVGDSRLPPVESGAKQFPTETSVTVHRSLPEVAPAATFAPVPIAAQARPAKGSNPRGISGQAWVEPGSIERVPATDAKPTAARGQATFPLENHSADRGAPIIHD